MFFLISSFLTWESIERKYVSYLEWGKRKVQRTIPLYYLALIFAIIVSGKISAVNFAVHVLGIWGLFPTYHNCVMAEWYLGALILFWAVAPYLHRHVRTLGRALAFFVLSCVFSGTTKHIFGPILQKWALNDSSASYIGNTSIWAQLPVLALGIVLYYIIHYLDDLADGKRICNLPKENVFLAASVWVIVLSFSVGALFDITKIWGLSPYSQVAIGFGGMAICMHVWPIRIINNQLFSWLGENSYGIYLFHFTLIHIFDRFFNANTIAIVFLRCIYAITVSLLVSLCFDKLRKKIKTKRI